MIVHNFSAGPSAIPQTVLQQLQEELCDFGGTGYSLLCMSHRGDIYEEVHQRAINGIRAVLRVPETHSILLLGGGASLQFGMIPMNFAQGRPVGIALTGKWAEKTYADLKRVSLPHIVWARNGDEAFPPLLECEDSLTYVHITSNETIDGVQWWELPECGTTDLVVDASSDIGSRAINITRCAGVYAGAQKNLGIAGVSIVILRNDMFDRIPQDIPAYLNFETHRKSDSLYNTPPVFAIRVLDLVLQWIEEQGGVDAIEQNNRSKSQMLYSALDAYPDVYTTVKNNRSSMNIVWNLGSKELTDRFLSLASAEGFVGLKGHRSLGGLRASLYNAVTQGSVDTLADFVRQFAEEHSK